MAVSVERNAGPRATTPMSFGGPVACPFPTVTAAFYHHVSSPATQSNVAVRDLSGAAVRELTYAQLAGHAQALALRLRGLGIQPRQRIPLVVRRGLEMVVGIWAILSCGAQYVPLDGGVVPDSTVKHVIEQAGGDIVLCLKTTEHRIRSQFPHLTPVLVDEGMAEDVAEPVPERWIDLASPEAGCYVIYTSGTTGKPKGVDVTHRNVANLVCLSPGGLGIRPGMCVGQVLNISFDMAAWEIFACLCNGGTLVVRGPSWEPTIRELDVLICTPTILSKYQPAQYPKIKAVATAGEPTSQALADLWASHATYWNCCGPTETTIVNTMSRHVAGVAVSIGRPTPNNSVYILDEAGNPVPNGVSGVMWAGGHGVSRGYVGLPSKTSESYIHDPFLNDGSKMYCTGDLGQWRSDGSIDILGRCDDQIKVKGFRVELDGISSSLASAPGVSRTTALMVDGKLHGFVVPSGQSIEAVFEHVRKVQPYYAVPTKIHQLDEFPTTANGKTDKKMLRAAVEPLSGEITPSLEGITPVLEEKTPSLEEKSGSGEAEPASEEKRPGLVEKESGFGEKNPTLEVKTFLQHKKTESEEKRPALPDKLSSDCGTLVETGSMSSSTLTAVSDTPDLDQDLPGKQLARPIRGLRLRVLIVYRRLFSFVGLLNLAGLIAIVILRPNPQWLAILTAANLVTAVLVRQDVVINIIYTLFCSMPRGAPLWLRSRCAKVYHLGGVHSGAGVCATSWLLASTIRSTVAYARARGSAAPRESIATIVVSWLLSALLCTLVGFAWPSFRKNHHNLFERLHRFLGWLALCIFWARTVLSIRDTMTAGQSLGQALVRNPGFWMLVVATCSIASSWAFLRRVPVNAVPLSDHAAQLHFGYAWPVKGSFTRISTRPLLEWHSFATIPTPQPSDLASPPGYSLVVSNAGDWTKTCINNPPTQLIWSTPNPEQTFGRKMIDTIRQTIPAAVIHDTRVKGRPDLVKMGYNLAKSFGAEAVIIIANEKITKKVVYGLESRGFPAYGAIWDS